MRIVTADDLAAEQAEAEKEARRAEARAYLSETDWMVTRQAETGKPIPDDVRDARNKARDTINSSK
jgi:hypothetical protein